MTYVRRLVWDEGNIAHIARHGVNPEEVEQACHGQSIEHEAYGGRVMLIGPTMAARLISVVLEPEGEEGIYYVVTARDSSQRERRIYSTQPGGREIDQ